MPQLGKILVRKYASVAIAQLNGIYLWEIVPRRYVLGSKGKTKVDPIHHTQGIPKIPVSKYRARDVG